ncbi:MAG: hypothetical protein V1835_01705 [Candidatus Micrarchaeota archaeon]
MRLVFLVLAFSVMILLPSIAASGDSDASKMSADFLAKLADAKASGADVSEIEEILQQADEIELQGNDVDANAMRDIAIQRLDSLGKTVKDSKLNMGWIIAGVLLLLVAIAAFLFTRSAQQPAVQEAKEKKSDPSKKRPATIYDTEISEDFGEKDPENRIDISLKRKGLDID